MYEFFTFARKHLRWNRLHRLHYHQFDDIEYSREKDVVVIEFIVNDRFDLTLLSDVFWYNKPEIDTQMIISDSWR